MTSTERKHYLERLGVGSFSPDDTIAYLKLKNEILSHAKEWIEMTARDAQAQVRKVCPETKGDKLNILAAALLRFSADCLHTNKPTE